MLSRVAETIYWMSRQVERAENISRFLEVTWTLTLDQPENLIDPWAPLVQVTADDEYFKEKYGDANANTVTQFLAFDAEYHSSMLTVLRAARENARGVRETLSSEAYEQLNDFYHFVNNAAASKIDPTPEFFDTVRQKALLWTGIVDSTMSHDMSWHFANVGRMIERADKTSRILDVKYFNLLPRVDDVGTAIDDLQWSALLLAISGFEAYRRKHRLIELESVIEFFLFNEDFPRSVRYSVASADWSLQQIEKESSTPSEGQEDSAIAKAQTAALRHRLSNTSVKEVLAGGMHQFIDAVQIELNNIGTSLNHDYFHAAIPS
tara:strand:- start:217105 stop:218067 length:963 start_codon:yes stop_codon:yes gene_type:complete